MVDFHTVIIGGGVIGLAIGRALAQKGKEVIILETASKHGTGTSSRNSGVIHAGIYYPKGSLKAQFCVEGKELLYEFADKHKVAYKKLGKLIVGQFDDEEKLQKITEKAKNNGVEDLKWLSKKEISNLEPELNVSHALFSPSTGIVDVHSYMNALEGEFTRFSGQIAVKSNFQKAVLENHDTPLWKVWVSINDQSEEFEINCNYLINAAGLEADAVANRIQGLKKEYIPQVFYAKGNYASFSKRCPFKHLIYPTPVTGGLGTHLTLDVGGQGQLGPDVEWLGPADTSRLPGSSLGTHNYEVDKTRLKKFAHDVQRWWPSLDSSNLAPAYSGIRPKLSSPTEPPADFFIQGPQDNNLGGLIQLFGIESPGLTASLAIANHVVKFCRF